jgi:hypothetical protein
LGIMTTGSTNTDSSRTDSSTGVFIRDLGNRALGGLRRLLPQRFRRDRPIVPVVRLTGIIGFSTPLRPGLTLAGIALANWPSNISAGSSLSSKTPALQAAT